MKFMKKYFALLFLIGCNTSLNTTRKLNDEKTIVYLLPNNVKDFLKKSIEKDEAETYFCLYSDSIYYIIYIGQNTTKTDNPYVKKTNRKVFIDGNFYPLIFQEDMIFATTASPNEILKEYATEEYLTKKIHHTIHEGYYIKFLKNGKILDSGHALSK